jgi:hypothetical protein
MSANPKPTKVSEEITVSQVLKWKSIGQTYNEEWGVDDIRAKKINGQWVYAQIHYRHGVTFLGFVLINGKMIKDDD